MGDLDLLPGDLPGSAVFIIGSGHFGTRAARLLESGSRGPVYVVEVDEERLSAVRGLRVKEVRCDGIEFLVGNFHLLKGGHTIVPALPVHLAFEWLKRRLAGSFRIAAIPVPGELPPLMPHAWKGGEGSLLVSYADFKCPDNCPEPEYCTVTGQKHDPPMFELLQNLEVPGFRVRVIRSRQLAPGLGGYRVRDLSESATALERNGQGKWLIGTACKCHGVLTALSIT